MAISIARARARAKENSATEKAKRAPLSISQTTPMGIKESTKPATKSNSNNYKTKTSERQIPSHVKPKLSWRPESESHSSFKHLNSDAAAQKPTVSRRQYVEKSASPSISSKPKAKDLSSSRLHKTQPLLRTSSTPTPSPSPLKPKASSKPTSKKTTLKTPKAAKPKPSSLSTKGENSSKIFPTTNKKAVDAPVNLTNTPESSDATVETTRLETMLLVKEQEGGVLKVEDNERQEAEKASKISPHVGGTEQHEQHHKLETDQPNIQADDERVIPKGEPVSVTEEEEAKGEPKEEKKKEDHGEKEGTSQGESNNWRQQEEQLATNGEVEVKEKEKEEDGVIQDDEGVNKNEGKALKENEGEETGTSEDRTDGDELAPKSEIEEDKKQPTPPKEGVGKEFQAQTNVAEETANNLLETRKNKVRALAGAFQSVIDHQGPSR
ncbi:uncharacterized protein LOC129294114 [Prosopis cineraria]|uniref:uncharacterized protein LOC129294114 n=1 Tax=Prosopis cineraria TaxID=364024 RepID=UPI00240F6502|nr:uncharacterized protein LOC129294114 [Prosopis cineraria]